MKVLKIPIWLLLAILLAIGQPAFAAPTFQVYIVNSTPMDYNGDQDTWVTTDSSFTLRVVGAYKDGTTLLTEGTILLSVPEGETGGTITITAIAPGDYATLLHTKQSTVIPDVYNPETKANIDLLTNEVGNPSGYDGYQTKNFFPDDVTFNNHYPMQDDVSNFLIYDIGDFEDSSLVHNYNADTSDPDYVDPGDPGFPPVTGNLGEEKDFTVTVSGFSWVHFDAYGYELIDTGTDLGPVKNLVSSWDINPGSHDATYIPAPGAILLGSIGVGLVGWLRRRRSL